MSFLSHNDNISLNHHSPFVPLLSPQRSIPKYLILYFDHCIAVSVMDVLEAQPYRANVHCHSIHPQPLQSMASIASVAIIISKVRFTKSMLRRPHRFVQQFLAPHPFPCKYSATFLEIGSECSHSAQRGISRTASSPSTRSPLEIRPGAGGSAVDVLQNSHPMNRY